MVGGVIFMYMGLPYVYKITSTTGEYYYGVRWSYDGDPSDDFWKKYFTSSDTICEMVERNGKNYFTPEILFVFDDALTAQNKEMELIKSSIHDPMCLNKAVGKCIIWSKNPEIKKKMTENLNKFYSENGWIKIQLSECKLGDKNPNYGIKPWKNSNGCIESWEKAAKIHTDFKSEKWDLTKKKYGRTMLMRRYGLAQGSARKMLDLFRKGWNPSNDPEYMNFFGHMAE